jgi:predicted enzyme related to lactoylglutathione lyase
MKSKILGLRTVVYSVPNLNTAKEWYSQVFETKPYFDEIFYAGFDIMGYELGLVPIEKADSLPSENIITYWGVENIESEYARFIALGANAHEAPTNVGGNIMVASVKDPWNNVIGLIYNPDFKLPQ